MTSPFAELAKLKLSGTTPPKKPRKSRVHVYTRPVYIQKMKDEFHLSNEAIGKLIGVAKSGIASALRRGEVLMPIEHAVRYHYEHLTAKAAPTSEVYVVSAVLTTKEAAKLLATALRDAGIQPTVTEV